VFRVPDGVELVLDPSVAQWLVERLRPWGGEGVRVAGIVPDVYEAYVRILHPAREDGIGEVRWSTLAERRERMVGPETSFEEISGLDPHTHWQSWNRSAPSEGNLSLMELRALAAALETFTSSPDRCWFGIWEGYGFWWSTAHSPLFPPDTDPQEIAAYRQGAQDQDEILRRTPRVEAENRAYFLFRGPLSAADSFSQFEPWYQSPNLWWPDDRTWCVATEIDGYSTHLGGSKKCVDRVLAATELETIRVTPDTPLV
jgi:hypothetical protein